MTLQDARKKFLFLEKAGMDADSLKELSTLHSQKDTSVSQIRILRKFRYELLEDIHKKQQYLDTVDYLIHELKEKGDPNI